MRGGRWRRSKWRKRRRRREEEDRVDQSNMTLEHNTARQSKRRHHQLQGMQRWSQRACWVTVLQVYADKRLS